MATISGLTFSLNIMQIVYSKNTAFGFKFGQTLSNFSLVLRALCSLDISSVTPKNHINHTSFKILIYSILLFGMFNCITFNAVLYSYLTVREELPQVETLEDIATNHNLQLVQFRGFSSNSYFSEATDITPYAFDLWKRTIEDNQEQAFIPSDDLKTASKKLEESRNNILLIPEDMIPELVKVAGTLACQACYYTHPLYLKICLGDF